MDLNDIRQEINQVDAKLVELFVKRMELAAQVADYKKEKGLPIYVPAREREVLESVAKLSGPEMEAYTRELYSTLFALSRSYQNKRNSDTHPIHLQNPTNQAHC